MDNYELIEQHIGKMCRILVWQIGENPGLERAAGRILGYRSAPEQGVHRQIVIHLESGYRLWMDAEAQLQIEPLVLTVVSS